MYYSKLTGGFYSTELHGNDMPADVVEISDEQYANLVGKNIVADENGYPIAIDQPLPVRTKNTLLDEVANKRWQVETDGILVAGHPIATDRESQAQLTNAYTLLKSGLIADTPWKSADGSFTLVTLPTLEPVAQAVGVHVRACFAAEKVHTEAIDALQTQPELDTYDINAGWPSGR